MPTDGSSRNGRLTPVKTRIMAGGYQATRQQVVRLDREPEAELQTITEDALVTRLTGLAERADAILVSDYGYGTVTPRVFERIRAIARRTGAVVSVDSRYQLPRFTGVTAATPNEAELEQLAGTAVDDERGVEKAGRQLLERLEARLLLVTRGSRGMALLERDGGSSFIPIHDRRDRRRHRAATPCSRRSGGPRQRGGRPRGRTRQPWTAHRRHERGTATVSPSRRAGSRGPVAGGSDRRARLRADGKRVVLANVCFDSARGHVRFRPPAPRDVLTWCSTPTPRDAPEGPGRPLMPAAERAEILAGLRAVDHVVVFDEDTADRLVSLVRPAVHAKGTDYTDASVPEAASVRAAGGRVAIVGDPKDHATRDLIARIRERFGATR